MCTHQGVCHIFMRTTTRIFLCKNSFIFVRQYVLPARILPTFRIIPSTLLRISALAALCRPCFFSYHRLCCPCAGFRTIRRRIVDCGRERPAAITTLVIMMPVFLPFASRVVSAFKRTGWRGVLGLALGAGVHVVARGLPHPSVGHWAVYPFYRAPDNAAHCFDDVFHGYRKARRDRTYSYCCGHVQRGVFAKIDHRHCSVHTRGGNFLRAVIPSIAPRTIVSAMVCGRVCWACTRILLWVLVSIVIAVGPALTVTTIVRGTTIVVSAIVSVVIVVVVATLIERSVPASACIAVPRFP